MYFDDNFQGFIMSVSRERIIFVQFSFVIIVKGIEV